MCYLDLGYSDCVFKAESIVATFILSEVSLSKMPTCTILRVNDRLGVFSWTTGFKETTPPTWRSEHVFLCHLLWLEKHGRSEEADLLLELYCRERRHNPNAA